MTPTLNHDAAASAAVMKAIHAKRQKEMTVAKIRMLEPRPLWKRARKWLRDCFGW